MPLPAPYGTGPKYLMPIYEYRCLNGHTFEAIQSMSDAPVERCEQCKAPVERVFHPIAVHFKGSGFYTTDYARKGAKASASDGGGSKESKESKGSKGSKESAGDSKDSGGKKETAGSKD